MRKQNEEWEASNVVVMGIVLALAAMIGVLIGIASVGMR